MRKPARRPIPNDPAALPDLPELARGPAPAHATAAVAALGLVNVPRSCEVLAERLQQRILDGSYAAGAMLPSERELVAESGLSRGSVREALRILEAQGLVRTRAGRYGGSLVSRPSDDLLGSHINLFAKGRSVSLRALVEARQALEPMVAFLAARNRTADDLAALAEISRQLDEAAEHDVPRFLAANAAWHKALAVASHNDLLRAFTASISGLMFEASRIDNFASPDVRRLVTHAHRRILQAIEAGDADAARRRSERDIQAYGKHLEATLQSAGRGRTAKETTP